MNIGGEVDPRIKDQESRTITFKSHMDESNLWGSLKHLGSQVPPPDILIPERVVLVEVLWTRERNSFLEKGYNVALGFLEIRKRTVRSRKRRKWSCT